MSRFSKQTRYVPELPRSAELLWIAGIRLQCIHFLNDAPLGVCEVLSQVHTPFPLDPFLKHLSIMVKQQLFLWQVQWVLTLSGSYSLNLSVRMLTSLSWTTYLVKQGHQGRIVVETQDPGSMMRLDKAKQQAVCIAVKTLVCHGFRVWLGDVPPGLFFIWRLSGIRFDAIKIESGVFHQFGTSE